MRTTKERTLSILRSIERQGMDRVIEQIDTIGYFNARCHGHHHYTGDTEPIHYAMPLLIQIAKVQQAG